MLWTIRRAEAQDAAAMLQLAQAFATSFVVDPGAFHTSLAALQQTTDAYVAVAELNGQVVGYVVAFCHPTFFANGPVAWVEEVMVAAPERRHGIGRTLVEAAEVWARTRDCRLIALATRRAAEFYRELGYAESATYFRKLL